MKTSRQISEREIAIAMVLAFAEGGYVRVALYGYYDDDHEYIVEVARRLETQANQSLTKKMIRVMRRLVSYNVFHAKMGSTQKYYTGEPTHQMSYWLRPGKADLINGGEIPGVRMDALGETEFLLRHAYTNPDYL